MHPRLRLALEFLLYAVLTTFMLHATWLTWPDAFIDFSRELYLPWRVSQGDVLYRDLAYYFGPVSVYTNAAFFALLLRPSIHALFALNFAFWMATLLAFRALLRRIASPLAATLAVSVFILLFSFSRYTGIGNDNFLAPYSHEITRGFLFALLALLALDSTPRRHSFFLALLSGFLLGLTLFSKPEIALAAVSSSAVLLFFWERGRPARSESPPTASHSSLVSRLSSLFLPFAFGLLAALALVLVPLSIVLGSFPQALRHGLLKLYLDCFNPALTSLPYFKEVMGTDAILPHVLRLFLGAALAVSPFLLARCLLPRLSSRPLRLAATVLLAFASAALGWFAFFPLNAALPLAPVAFLAILWGRRRPAFVEGSRASPVLCRFSPLSTAFAVFALVLVSKIALNAGIGHYGFVLALPAFSCAVVLAFPPKVPPLRLLSSAALLAGFSAFALHMNAGALQNQRTPIHDGTFFAPPLDARAFNAALDWIRGNTPPDSTLSVLPEGSILNVLSGRPNPTPYASLEQPACLRFGSIGILAAYSNSLPDTLVLVQTAPPRFGIDYAQDLMAFLDPLYTPAFVVPVRLPAGESIPYLLVARKN